jgi:hypothetical protein
MAKISKVIIMMKMNIILENSIIHCYYIGKLNIETEDDQYNNLELVKISNYKIDIME